MTFADTDPDKTILSETARDASTLACPLCDHTIDVPPVQVSDSVAGVFGFAGDTLARMQAEQIAHATAREMRTHLGKHKPEEWLTRPPQLHPAEHLALLAGIGPALDGKPIPENTALMCVLALARLTGKHNWTKQ